MKTKFAPSFCILSALLNAQTTTTLLGTVTDKSGAVVPNADVTATNTGANLSRTAKTNGQGEYRIDFLPWELSSNITLESGTPFTVTTGKDNNLDGNTNDRATTVGVPALDPHRGQSVVSAEWFNPAAFIPGANGTDGTSSRNLLDAPGAKNVDLGLFRNFRIHESILLQARGEFTNAFNIVNLSTPTASLSSSLVGQIRGAAAMRQVQLGLRLTF